ncbi:hypothetical protein AB0C04_07230 [Micromonospora sp. NPDC048909]|uniref:hypothetical protein n=1 Tax=Micromonospora sp. NPDC048909 TaxID=3155643 RepID=UPI0033FF8310
MNGRRVVLGGLLLTAGMLAVVPAATVLLAGDVAALPIMIFGLAAAVFGAARLRGGLRAPAPPRVARGVPGPRRRYAETSSPPMPYYSTSDYPYTSDGGHHREGDRGSIGDHRGEGFGGDSGGGWSGGGGGDSGGGGGGS